MSKNVNIKINADSKKATKEIDKTVEALNRIGKEIKRSSLNKLSNTISNFAVAFKGVTAVISAVTNSIKELNTLYIKQAKAEKQLETASKNNPYLTDYSVAQLKKYASELQKIGTIGDEELLPLMAQLASAGRTQAEIQNIMATALDVSASGAMSLDNAVKNLNATYGGTAGQLGKIIPDVKNLTKEQLQNGEAIKLISEKYKGMSEEVSKTTGAGQKLANVWGDFKESLGSGFNRAITPVQNFFTKVISGWTDAISKKNEYAGISTDTVNDATTSQGTQTYIDGQKIKVENLKKMLSVANGGKLEDDLKAQKKSIENDRNNELSTLLQKKGILARERGRAFGSKFYDLDHEVKQIEKQLDEVSKKYKTKLDVINSKIKDSKTEEKNLLGAFFNEYSLSKNALLNDIENTNQKILEAEKKKNEQLAEENKTEVERQKQEQEELAKKAKEKYQQTVKNAQTEIDFRKKSGEKITEEDEKQTMLNVKMSAYVEMLKDAKGTITENNDFAKTQAEEIAKIQAELLAMQDDKNKESLIKKWLTPKPNEIQELQQEIANLESLMPTITDEMAENEKKKLEERTQQIKTAIANIQTEIDKLDFQKAMNKVQELFNSINGLMQSFGESINQIFSTATQQTQRQTENEIEDQRRQYEEGATSFEEYQAKKDELEKKSAQKQYRLQLAQWHMDVAMAQSKSALAFVNALSSGTPPVNILNAVTTAVLGTAQLVQMMSARPQPPSFATGGFLTGNSYSGDKIPFMGNAGEAILNPAEQRTFMNMANGNYNGGGVNISLPINIQNNIGDSAKVSASANEREIKITVDKIVKTSLQNGTYTQSLQYAEGMKKGVTLL